MPTRIQLRKPCYAYDAESGIRSPLEARSTQVPSFTTDTSSGADSSDVARNTSSSFRVQNELASHISSTDIVASPRLVGYMFCFTSSLVLMISSIMYKNNSDIEVNTVTRDGEIVFDDRFYFTSTHSILKYKMNSAIAWGAVGCFYNFFIVMIHFDKKCQPGVWSYMFKDGSKGERNLLFFLLIFWMAGVHICTSAYSVGNDQINCYFSSWICLWTTFLTYESWREGAELTPLYDKFNVHSRKTMFKWAAGLFFAAIGLFSILDSYIEWLVYDIPNETSVNDIDDISTSEWIKGLTTLGSLLLLSYLLFVINLQMLEPFGSRCWRYIELFSILSFFGVSGYTVFEFTGVDRYINSPSNPYFSMWGMLLASMLMIGDWLEEFNKENNKSMAQVTPEDVSVAELAHSASASEQQSME